MEAAVRAGGFACGEEGFAGASATRAGADPDGSAGGATPRGACASTASWVRDGAAAMGSVPEAAPGIGGLVSASEPGAVAGGDLKTLNPKTLKSVSAPVAIGLEGERLGGRGAGVAAAAAQFASALLEGDRQNASDARMAAVRDAVGSGDAGDHGSGSGRGMGGRSPDRNGRVAEASYTELSAVREARPRHLLL